MMTRIGELKAELDRIKLKSECQAECIDAFDKKLREAEAENARLRALDSLKTISLTDSPTWQTIGAYAEVKEENARLKAEVERLTKAGDALAGKAIRLEYNDYWSEYEKVEDVCIDEVEAWHKAKEGKQS